ncbi:MAG: hypothetical protein IIV78_02455 [Oscillospiraceae bacterium]|nr:hypothetical protein [Oscillospiraceae bacterium]MBQ5739251.1 hypothetical protein [Oscillospiraceae bacterium]
MKQYTVKECLAAFCAKMNEKAAALGMHSAHFVDAAGIANEASARDILRLVVAAAECAPLQKVWSTREYTACIGGENAREIPLVSKTLANVTSGCLTDHYHILGGKGGTLTRQRAFSTAVLAQVEGEVLACVVMYAQDANEGPQNRWEAARRALDAALGKGEDTCAACAAVCRLSEPETLLYAKNVDEVKMPASMSKILTALIVYEYLSEDETLFVTQELTDSVQPRGFYVEDIIHGDTLTVRDAMRLLMLPSSNATAFLLAEAVGRKILAGEKEGLF